MTPSGRLKTPLRATLGGAVRHWARATLVASLFSTGGCWLVVPEMPAEEESAEVYAPPQGLPDLRPLLGLDPNHWAPAFMPALSQAHSMEQVLNDLPNLEVVETYRSDSVLVDLVPKNPGELEGLRSVQLFFHSNTVSGPQRLGSAELMFSRNCRYEPAFRQYLVHVLRKSFAYISAKEAEQKHAVISGEDGASVQLLDGSDGVGLKITFPREITAGRFVSEYRSKRPTYTTLLAKSEQDFVPPTGTPDARPLIGLNRDQWAPAFGPAFTRRNTYTELASALSDFELQEKQNGSATFVPKLANKFPQVNKVLVRFQTDSTEEFVEGIDLVLTTTQLDPYFDHLATLAQYTFGGRHADAPLESIMVWTGDHGAAVQLTRDPLKLSYTLPKF